MSTIKCPHCGKALPSESAFCPYCMEQIKEPVAVSVPVTKDNKGMFFMAVITIALLSMVAVLVLLRFFGDKDDRTTLPAEATVNTEETMTTGVSDNMISGEAIHGETSTTEPQTSGNVTETTTEGVTDNSTGNVIENITEGATEGKTEGITPAEPTTEKNNSQGGQVNNTTTEPQAAECNHSYVAKYETIHHEEKGHYEEVPTPITSTQYKCAVCGDMFDTLDEYYAHFDSTHISYPGYNVGVFREKYSEIGSVYYVTTEKWVVDSEAYDEVITSYECSKCGKVK